MDKKFLSLNSNMSLSQPAAMADNANNGDKKEVKKRNCSNVSFSQKQALLKFMDENKQLALPNYKNEDLWKALTNILNNLGEGAVKPVEHWQRVWKIWCTKVQKKRNDLSITLLDLQLLTFLKSIGEMEYEIKNLKNVFFNFITNTEMKLDYKELISIAEKIPELKQTEAIINYS